MSWVPNKWQRAILIFASLGFSSMFFQEVMRYGAPKVIEGSVALVGAACAACLALHNIGKQ